MDTARALQGINHAADNTAEWRTVLLPSRSSMWLSHPPQNQGNFVSFHCTVSLSALCVQNFGQGNTWGNKVALLPRPAKLKRWQLTP